MSPSTLLVKEPGTLLLPNDESWMRIALALADEAAAQGEVPVGAIVVQSGRIVGEGRNTREAERNPLGHAELQAIAQAAKRLDSWRLSECELYVTLEPCVMCAGALHQARMKRVVFGAFDPKAGALGSLYEIHKDDRLNHRFVVESGILEQSCGDLLKSFFQARRRRES